MDGILLFLNEFFSINATSYFSDCSLDTLSSGLRRGVDYCLHNVPKIAFGGAKCGNGILEDGEVFIKFNFK